MPYTPDNFCRVHPDFDFYQFTFFGYEQECTKCGQLRRHWAIPEMFEQHLVETGVVPGYDEIT